MKSTTFADISIVCSTYKDFNFSSKVLTKSYSFGDRLDWVFKLFGLALTNKPIISLESPRNWANLCHNFTQQIHFSVEEQLRDERDFIEELSDCEVTRFDDT